MVVHDVVIEEGEAAEDTHDWYAQDKDGNICTSAKTRRVRERQGQEHRARGGRVDGAEAGILFPATRSAWCLARVLQGEAEDVGEILSLDEKASVVRSFDAVLKTTTRLAGTRRARAQFYAKGGPVPSWRSPAAAARSTQLQSNDGAAVAPDREHTKTAMMGG
jgi:hypothetical protein